MLDINTLPEDAPRLRALLIEQHQMVQSQSIELQNRKLEIERLKFVIAKLQRWRFGRSSERLDGDIAQLQLTLEALQSATLGGVVAADPVGTVPVTPRKVRPIRSGPAPRTELPAHFVRRDEVRQPAECSCPECGGPLRDLGVDQSEILEAVPVTFTVTRYIRPKKSCRRCAHIVQAPAPSRPIDKSYAGASMLALVLNWKYGAHLPLYRQQQIFAHQGLDLSRSTLSQWVGSAATLLAPLAQAVSRHVLAGHTLHADDTPIKVLDPGRGKTKRGHLWTYVRDERPWGSRVPPAVWYQYSSDWSGTHPQAHLRDYRGALHADDYAGFEKLYQPSNLNDGARIVEVSCMGHSRRRIYEVYDLLKSPLAREGLDQIAQLYAIEDRIRGQSPEIRRAVRQADAVPVLNGLHTWLLKHVTQFPKTSAFGRALRYPLKHWTALNRYSANGTLEIDNLAAERSLRGIAVGRRNYLFLGSDNGGDSAAVIYCLIESAKLNSIDPHAYLHYVLERIADHPVNKVDALLPWNVAEHLNRERAGQYAPLACAA